MKSFPSSLTIDLYVDDKNAIAFCDEFLHGSNPKYVFGRNECAASIAGVVEVNGFIDDFTSEIEFLGKPVIRVEDLPKNAMVVSAVIGVRPITVQQRLINQGIRQLDYFSFRKYSGTQTIPVWFLDDSIQDFDIHRERYDWIYSLLQDDKSRLEFNKIIHFRLTNDLKYMEGFTDAQHRQYFEDFLVLRSKGEVFVDVGCFDGYTSLEFIKLCPNYAAVHVFEPEPGNMATVKEKLAGYPRIYFHPYGLSNVSQTLRFSAQGSSSRISDQGEIEIKVESLDDVLHEPFTFLKMDIEGEEISALEGAKQAIIKHHPRLAISVYHKVDALWRIPQCVLSYRDDYKIFLRHYTESFTETVMFFVPK